MEGDSGNELTSTGDFAGRC